MADNETTTTGGLGLVGVLTVVFVTLRLTNLISWPWVWVLSPIWIPFAIAVVIIAIALALHAIKAALDKKHK